MDILFEKLKNNDDFRVEVIMYLRRVMDTRYVNYDSIHIDPHPYRYFGPNEVPLKIGDMSFICTIHGDGIYAFR